MADAEQGDLPYQSLYRRFRPSTFAEVRGQDHVVLALRNAVRDGRVAHAYLFSGPRGTGKTSTARILAKALNCTDLRDGEPCGVCPSCVEIAKGTSLDVHELDAASNNGVEAMRDLVSRAALGTPGRQKVYIVDEVHMLSTAASNALLKTLEEPPAHVVFVLATTDPQKVLPTIRSRTQHFEFRLLGAGTLGELLEQVRRDADLDVSDEALDLALRRGRGSARDALSVLDQVAASEVVDDDLPELDEVLEALIERDAGRALVAVASLSATGFGPQQLAADLVDLLHQGFLGMVAPDLMAVGGTERDTLAGAARRLGLAAVVRAMEALGRAQVEMRDAPDPRVNLELALARLAHPDLDGSPEALLARIERLEHGGATLPAGTAAASSPPAPPARVPTGDAPPSPPPPAGGRSGEPEQQPDRPAGAAPPTSGGGAGEGPDDAPGSAPAGTPDAGTPDAGSGGPAMARKTLGAVRRSQAGGAPVAAGPSRVAAPPQPGPSGAAVDAATPRPVGAAPSPEGAAGGDEGAAPVAGVAHAVPAAPPPAQQAAPPTAAAQPAAAPGGVPPLSRDRLVQDWGDQVLGRLRPKAKALYQAGRFMGVDGDRAVFGLPNDIHRARCEELREDVEGVLSDHFGRPVALSLVVDDGSPAPSPTAVAAPDSGAPSPVRAPGAPPQPVSAPAEPSDPAPPSASAVALEPEGAARRGAGTPSGPPGARAAVARGPEAARSAMRAAAAAAGAPSDEPPLPDEPPEYGLDDFSVFDDPGPGEAVAVDNSVTARVLRAFPGAEEVN